MADADRVGAKAPAIFISIAAAWLGCCSAVAAAATRDPHSNVDPSQYVVRHAALDLEADFSAHRLRGAVDLTVERIAPTADRLLLATRGLEIEAVGLRDEAGAVTPLEHRLGPRDPILGRALEIHMPAPAGAMPRQVVRVEYSTGSDATALQWLAPEQTAGRVQPFLYTQSQPVYARSWIPVQDSPGIRFTYEARGALAEARNYEVLRSWLLLAVRSDYRPADARLESFLVGTGRHKMVKRLYEELARTPERRALGCRIYAQARPGYHPTTRQMVDALLPDCDLT